MNFGGVFVSRHRLPYFFVANWNLSPFAQMDFKSRELNNERTNDEPKASMRDAECQQYNAASGYD
jgi:hypothetical protein